MFLIKCYWILQNARVTAFTVSKLLREHQQGGKITLPPSQPRLELTSGSTKTHLIQSQPRLVTKEFLPTEKTPISETFTHRKRQKHSPVQHQYQSIWFQQLISSSIEMQKENIRNNLDLQNSLTQIKVILPPKISICRWLFFSYQHNDVRINEQYLDKNFSNICYWSVKNKLSIHFGEDKTKCILFGEKPKSEWNR